MKIDRFQWTLKSYILSLEGNPMYDKNLVGWPAAITVKNNNSNHSFILIYWPADDEDDAETLTMVEWRIWVTELSNTTKWEETVDILFHSLNKVHAKWTFR